MSDQFVSSGTAATIVVGVVIAYFYLRYFWAALRKAVLTRNHVDEGEEDRYHFSFAGAVISVVISATAIAIYGVGPGFLYLGPIAALLSPIAVTYCLYQDASS